MGMDWNYWWGKWWVEFKPSGNWLAMKYPFPINNYQLQSLRRNDSRGLLGKIQGEFAIDYAWLIISLTNWLFCFLNYENINRRPCKF